MNYRTLLLPFSLIVLASCASTHPGQMATKSNFNQPSSLPLVVSAETVELEMKSPFQLIEITIENKSEDWVRLSRGEVVIDNPATHKISTVVGPDLKDWARAMELQMRRDEHNHAILQSTLLFAGTALSGSKNSGVAPVGTAMVAGSYIWILSDAIQSAIRNAEKADAVPENHLQHPVNIPGKMFQRRWVLMNKPVGKRIDNLVIELNSLSGESEQYVIKI